MKHYEPTGVKFYDTASRREMMYSQDEDTRGWLLWKHPDGQWVTLRKATKDDIGRINLCVQAGLEGCSLLQGAGR